MLTKSNYLTGLQCPKLLWITKNDKERIPEPDEIDKKKFEEGDFIGKLATKNFPDGISLANEDFNDNLKKTKELINIEENKRKPIFEAGFVVAGLYSRADILNPVGDEWDIIEVKSSTKVKDINFHDVAFQKYIYERSGLKIRKCFLMHINSEYIKDGEINPEEFFIQADITEKVEEFSKNLEKNILKMLEIINSKECPDFNIEDLLTIEYDNICKDEFFDSLPEDNIFEFYRISKKKAVSLYKEGIVKIKDTPEDFKLNEKQQIQKDLVFNKGNYSDKNKIKDFLDNLNYPIYYLDFETINPALPKFDGMKPYQRIPFQFSLHIQNSPDSKKEELKHVSFLAKGKDDPRKEFMKELKANLGDKGSILVYNQSFEKGVLRECCEAFPEFKEWYENNVLPRIKDLWDVFRNFWFYDSRQKGSASIKAVLPVLSDLKYDDLEIKKGDVASFEWERINFLEDISEEEKKRIRENLEKYCELDTLAEVEILNGLRETVKY